MAASTQKPGQRSRRTGRRSAARPSAGVNIADLSAALSNRTDEVVKSLYPAASKSARHWSIGDVSGAKGESLYIHRSGAKAGNWTDTSTGQHGDLLDLVQAATLKTKSETVLWAKSYLGLTGDTPQPLQLNQLPKTDRDPDDEKGRQAAVRIWNASGPTGGTIAGTYLSARGISLPPGETIRFHPSLSVPGGKTAGPALVAAVSGPDRKVTAVHRIWLKPDGTGKAALPQAKMSRGPMRNGAARLAPAGAQLGLAEGIETGMSAMDMSGIPVWAALGTRHQAIAVPDQVQHLVIFADRGAAGERAALAAIEAHARPGRTIDIVQSPIGKDFNDLQQHLVKQGLSVAQQRQAFAAGFAAMIAEGRSIGRAPEPQERQQLLDSDRVTAPQPGQSGTGIKILKEIHMEMNQLAQIREAAQLVQRTELDDPGLSARQADLVKAARGLNAEDYKQLDAGEKATLSAARLVERTGREDQLDIVRQASVKLSMTAGDDPMRVQREANLVEAAQGLDNRDLAKLDRDQRELLTTARTNISERDSAEPNSIIVTSQKLQATRQAADALAKTPAEDPQRSTREAELVVAARGLTTRDYHRLDDMQKELLGEARVSDRIRNRTELVQEYRQSRDEAGRIYGEITGGDYSRDARSKATQHERYPEYDAARDRRNAAVLEIALNPEPHRDALRHAGITDAMLAADIQSGQENIRRRDPQVSTQLAAVREAAAELVKQDPTDKAKLGALVGAAVGMEYSDYKQLSVQEKSSLAFARTVMKEENQRQQQPDQAIDKASPAVRDPAPAPAVIPELTNLRDKIREIQEFKGMPSEKASMQRELLDIEKTVPKDLLKELGKPETKVLAAAAEKHLGVSR